MFYLSEFPADDGLHAVSRNEVQVRVEVTKVWNSRSRDIEWNAELLLSEKYIS